MVIMKRISRTIAMAKNSPIRPKQPILRYHTPCLITNGQSGNKTIAMTPKSAPTAYTFCFHCEPSYSQT